MKKILLLIIISLILTMLVSCTQERNTENESPEALNIETIAEEAISDSDDDSMVKVLFKFGQIESDHNDDLNFDVLIRGNDFVIYESEVNKREEQYRLTGEENGRELAISFLLKREALYSEALRQGYNADDKEIRDLINLNIELSASASNYEEHLLPFLKGLGMTNEEYWESQYDVLKKDLVISKYIQPQREAFFELNQNRDSKDIYDDWTIYMQNLVDELIEGQNLQFFESAGDVGVGEARREE
ncbi:MAG: hypothetical protein FWG70_08970 [Oscillospiraceae bacterium]|nr:hypothetical protein [Oscillospiraceae bacterium]